MLKTLWDEEVTRCLYFGFDSYDEKHMGCYSQVARAVDRVATQCGNLCGKIPRLVLKFDFKEGLHHVETLCEGRCVNKFLLDHCHFNTVMIIGLMSDWYELNHSLFLFNRMARWPRSMNVWMHNCEIMFFHDFPTSLHTELNMASPFAFTSNTWAYQIPISTVCFQIDQSGTEKHRYIGLQRGMDERRLFWPFYHE